MSEVPANLNRDSILKGITLVLAGAILASSALVHAETPETTAGDEAGVMEGWRAFHARQCADCHAIWGRGGRTGPDLGRLRTGRPSAAQLAGVMWNHIPKMLAHMKQVGAAPESITPGEMTAIFDLLRFVQQLDAPGDPAEGERVLRIKGCTECHSIDTEGGTIGPDLAQWGSYVNPIIWAQTMWEHAPLMEEAMKRSEMRWPKLEGADLVHIVAYVRSAGVSAEKKYLRPGSAARGRELFAEKNCGRCHPRSATDLAKADLPTSIGALASRMWNHSPEMTNVMREKQVARQSVSPQELADILTYILMRRSLAQPGDPATGKQVFERKGCTQCHESAEKSDSVGPRIGDLSDSATAANMAAAMWNHGEAMLQRMTKAEMSWPMFDPGEMVDLLAYLKVSSAPTSAGFSERQEAASK